MKITEGVMCDKCHDLITDNEEKQGETLHYGRTDYHVSCYIQYLRDKGVRFDKKVVIKGQVYKEAS